MKFITPEGYSPVNGNRIIWRYMSLDKFLHMILNNRLILAHAESFTDKNEFSSYLRALEDKQGKLINQNRNNEADALYDIVLNAERSIARIRERTNVSCWSLDKKESYALWKIYLGGASAGVAIKSTVSKLQKSLNGSGPVEAKFYAGEIDYEYPSRNKDDITDHDHILVKGAPYSYEKEYRVYTIREQEKEPSRIEKITWRRPISLNLNVDSLIQEILISPFAGRWFGDTIKKFLKHAAPELTGRISYSRISDN